MARRGAVYVPWMAMEPSLVAGRDESEPRRAPMGVRATPTMQTSRGFRPLLSSFVVAAALDDAMVDRWVKKEIGDASLATATSAAEGGAKPRRGSRIRQFYYYYYARAAAGKGLVSVFATACSSGLAAVGEGVRRSGTVEVDWERDGHGSLL